ncbi:MAG: DUF2975 domain-containing protein [Rhizomicrobium sp.]
MNKVGRLPKILHWLFAFFSVVTAIAAVVICIAIVVNPTLPAGTQFGPIAVDFAGQPGTVVLRSDQGNFDLAVTALRGNVIMNLEKGSALIDLLKHYGLPLMLLYTVFFAVLFDLLRRLFRNVARRESFTQQNLRLVQTIGISLLVFSVVSALGESWFSHAIYSYLVQNAMLTISGTPLHLPVSHGFTISGGHGSFGSPVFFSGLLVLALSEVFRQGLVLKRENDLTV